MSVRIGIKFFLFWSPKLSRMTSSQEVISSEKGQAQAKMLAKGRAGGLGTGAGAVAIWRQEDKWRTRLVGTSM